MKALVKIVLILQILSLFAQADEYIVVTHSKIKNLTKNQLKALYLKKLSFIDNIKIIPLNLEANNKIRKSFNKHILQMTPSHLKRYWMTQHYLGHRPPHSMTSQESIKLFVKKVDGAIGYINAVNLDDTIHVIYRWKD